MLNVSDGNALWIEIERTDELVLVRIFLGFICLFFSIPFSEQLEV